MKCEFLHIGDEASAVLDLIGINHDTVTGVVEFPENVQIDSDQDEFSQPSYYTYQIGQEVFVYPLETQTLVVE